MSAIRAKPLLIFSGRIHNIQGKVRKDRRDIWLRDVVVLTDDRILVSDFSNGLKLFDSSGKPLSRFRIPGPSAAVTLLSPRRAAFTIPFDGGPETVIVDVDLETGDMTHVKSVQTLIVNYRGIAALDESSWVSSTAWWNGAGAVDVINIDGERLKSFNTLAENKCMLECSSHLTVSSNGQYIASDGNASKVISVDPKADDNPIKFVFDGGKEGLLKLPLGIDCDSAGNIYVADQELSHVIVLSSDGTYLQTILDSKKDDLCKPTGVRIFNNKLYVTEQERFVRVFELTYEKL